MRNRTADNQAKILGWIRNPEHTLWLSRITQGIADSVPLYPQDLPRCLRNASSSELLDILARAMATPEEPIELPDNPRYAASILARRFRSNIPASNLSAQAREWLDQPQNAGITAQTMNHWSRQNFQETNVDFPDCYENPFTRCLARHWATPQDNPSNPPEWRIRPRDTASLLSQYTGIHFMTPDEAKAFWHTTRIMNPQTPLQKWATAHLDEVRQMADLIDRNSQSALRPNADSLAAIPQEIQEPFISTRPGANEEQPAINSTGIMAEIARGFGLSSADTKKNADLLSINHQILVLMQQLDQPGVRTKLKAAA